MTTTPLTHPPKIAIIGLGYVGLPLAVAFAELYEVIGYDNNPSRIAELLKGYDRTKELTQQEISAAKQLRFTHDPNEIRRSNTYIITVPTPLTPDQAPDLQYLLAATRLVGGVLKKGDLVIYESTVYPGCTEEDCVPVLEQVSGLEYQKDFYCGYSPERINPGDKTKRLKDIVKVTSGSNPIIATSVSALYKSIITAGVHEAPSIKVAEASKAIENAQRDVNISFMNELALIFDRMDIDTSDVIAAASTKWNFLPFRPGLVGGHCIGVDPHYLAHKAIQLGYQPQVILSGRRVNEQMGVFVAEKMIAMLAAKNKGNIQGCKVLILGIAFKENCPDTRNTKVVDIYETLMQSGIHAEVYDPWADKEAVKKEYGIQLKEELSYEFDALIIAVAHELFQEIDYKPFQNQGTLIFDTKSYLDRNLVTTRL